MESIPNDVFTQLIFIKLSNQDRIALLAAFPKLSSKVKWESIYKYKYDTLSLQLKEIHDKHFTITKQHRLDAIRHYYDNVNQDKDEHEDYDLRYGHQIPIVNNPGYFTKLYDYIYSIEDYIYDDILALKKEKNKIIR